MNLGSRFLEVLLPARCAACGRPAEALCGGCRSRLRAAPAGHVPNGVDWWVAPFAYDGPLRELIARAKYRGLRTGLPWLAEQVAECVAARSAGPVEVVTWPPTTRGRRRRRGFDPAEALARLVAGRLGVPARPLLHRRDGTAQTGRSRAQRVQGPSFVSAGPVPAGVVLLVDDVATTGATLAAAAQALHAGGAVSVAAATAGRTPAQVDLQSLKPPGGRAVTNH